MKTINEFKEMIKKYEGKLVSAEEFKQITELLEDEGVEVIGTVKIPTIILQDTRLAAESKLFYIFTTKLVGFNEAFAPKISAIATRLRLTEKQCEEAIEELLLFGYYELKGDALYRIAKPQLNREAFEGQLGDEWLTRQLGGEIKHVSIESAKNIKAKVVDVVLREAIDNIVSEITDDAKKIKIVLDFETGSLSATIE